jgi:uncharacterized protein
MWFDLSMQARDGSESVIRYNPHTSEIEGITLPDAPERDWSIAPRVTKTAPLGKSRHPKSLKIQMGLSCNYACSYCNQAFQINDATVSTQGDVERFLAQLETWIQAAPERIELWGGEPFVYWAKLKSLVPALQARFPESQFSIITNGSLLNREKLDFIARYDIGIGLSHDGPGQHLRGPDPLDDPEKRRWIETLLAERPGLVTINTVLTRENHSIEAIATWFREQLGPDVQLSLEGVVNTYDAATLFGSGAFGEDDLGHLSDEVFYALANDPNIFGLGERLKEFTRSLIEHRPVTALGQKCGMDREDQIAIDLLGNVMTCQNTGAKGVHKIGHVDAFAEIALDTATHFAFRPECMACPVVQLCKGSCMFLEGEFFAQSCSNEYAYNLGILRAALYHLTGLMLARVESSAA